MRRIFFFAVMLFVALDSLVAQNDNNCLDLNLNNISDTRLANCGDYGFALFQSALRQANNTAIIVSVYDTNMRKQYDTVLAISGNQQLYRCDCENSVAFVILKNKISRKEYEWTIVSYDFLKENVFVRRIPGLDGYDEIGNLHQISGNLFFAVSDKRRNNSIYYLPREADTPTVFQFSSDFDSRLLAVAADTSRGEFLFCLSAAGKVLLFITDERGTSKVAKIVEENFADAARIQKLDDGRFLLFVFRHSEEFQTFRTYIVDGGDLYSDENVYYSGLYGQKLQFPESLKPKLLFEVSQQAVVSQPRVYSGTDKTALVFDVYAPEYHQSYNGYYYDTRFYGYRYLRAEVAFFDTLGKLQNQTTFVYDDAHNLHSVEVQKTKVSFLKNGDILLYYMDQAGLTTYLLDAQCQIKDPIRTQEIPLKSKVYQRRNAEIDIFAPWYDCNKFILSAIQFSKENKNKKVGYIINKLRFE